MIIKYKIILLFILFFVVVETLPQIIFCNDIKPKKESLGPSIINLSDEELKYHSDVAIMLMNRCQEEDLTENLKLAEMRENYLRALYKIEATIISEVDSNKIAHELTYYIYIFIDNNTFKKSVEQWLNVVCIWGNNNEAILNSGFKKDCTADNNWLYWKRGDCPDILELEYQLKRAFNFEQIEKVEKAPKKKETKT